MRLQTQHGPVRPAPGGRGSKKRNEMWMNSIRCPGSSPWGRRCPTRGSRRSGKFACFFLSLLVPGKTGICVQQRGNIWGSSETDDVRQELSGGVEHPLAPIQPHGENRLEQGEGMSRLFATCSLWLRLGHNKEERRIVQGNPRDVCGNRSWNPNVNRKQISLKTPTTLVSRCRFWSCYGDSDSLSKEKRKRFTAGENKKNRFFFTPMLKYND